MKSIKSVLKNAILIIVVALCAGMANAITPPTPTEPAQAVALINWKMPTTRADNTPLALSEIRSINIYVTSLDSVIVVGSPATSYSYVLPAGTCLKTTDGVQATATDTDGRESAASNVAHIAADLCGPKPLPGAPTALTVTAG